jgi:hypothetical protein
MEIKVMSDVNESCITFDFLAGGVPIELAVDVLIFLFPACQGLKEAGFVPWAGTNRDF